MNDNNPQRNEDDNEYWRNRTASLAEKKFKLAHLQKENRERISSTREWMQDPENQKRRSGWESRIYALNESIELSKLISDAYKSINPAVWNTHKIANALNEGISENPDFTAKTSQLADRADKLVENIYEKNKAIEKALTEESQRGFHHTPGPSVPEKPSVPKKTGDATNEGSQIPPGKLWNDAWKQPPGHHSPGTAAVTRRSGGSSPTPTSRRAGPGA